MAEKLKNILSLTEILLEALTAESESWKDFLVFAARLYKYPFAEQLLIYGQRPDAVACASIEVWNHRMHRWVNRYAKGIALLDDSQSKMRLKYVFDFLDTHPGRDAKLPYLWKIREDQQRTIQTEMAQKLELDIEGEESFFHSLEKLCLREVYERIESYVGDFSRVGHDYETEPLLQLLSESVTYAVTSRCGIVPPEYNFDGLREFRTTEEISVLGTIVSELSKDILTEIRQIVATIERNEDNHKFAELLDDDYNEYNPEIDRSVLQAKEEPHDERDYLQSDRGIFVPELDRTDGRRYPTEQVWPEIQELFDGTSEGILQPTVIIGDIESASGADRRNNEPENRTVDTRVGAKRRHRRDAERDRSDEMGGAYEQYQAGSRGNDVSGIVVDETYGHEQASSRLLPPFFVGKNNEVLSEAVDCFLRSGANEKQSALRICGQYRKGKSKEENILFLQREFGNGNKGILVSGKSVSFSFSHDGVVIAEGNTTKQGNYRKISWTAMAERIAQLLEYGVYLSQEQLSQVEEQERNRVAEHLYGIYRDLPKEKRADFPLEFSGTVPEIRQYLAEQLSEREHIQSYISFLETLSPDRSERKKKQLQQELEDLLLEPIEFVASQERLSEPVLFITEDTVDEILQAGSQMENGKYRIYTFFQNESDLKMRTNFLKNEYGTGGYSNGWRSVMYDSKGISVSQSATLLAQPYGEKKLTWEQAAKRIERLIDTNRYINANELKSLADYLQEHDKSTQDDEVEEQAKITAATEPYEIGMHVYIDAKRYELGDITYDFVYLYDSEQTLFPLEYPRQEFEKQMEENPLNQIRFQTRKYSEETERPTQKVVNDEHIKQVVEPIEKLRYKITNETLGYGGAKEKYQANINAIRLLRTLEVEHRSATKEEQEVLAQYVGWGSLPMAFDEANATWSKEYQELKSILSEKEYKDARASTLNAHYTSPTIIRAIYQCIEKLGFRVGNLLEPSCGVGNFFGLLPESMQEVKLYGVELESIAGRIAKELYQDANITIAGFQETVYPDNFFDVAIGNVPFGQYQVSDKRYDHLKFSIHDYFFAKSLDQVRPGGVIAFITSHYTMDKKSENVRRYLAQRAVLLGAIRLPNNAFKANAGAEVVADILFLQKRERPAVIEESWVALGETNDGFKINQYFVDHPEMILGELKMETTQYGREECTCLPLEGVTLQEQLQRALLNIHGLIETREIVELEEKDTVIPADPTVQNFSYTIVDEGIYYRENSRMYPVDISEAAKDRIKEMIGLRECVRKLIAVQMEDVPDQELLLYQNELNVRYDQFQAKYGLLNASANNKLFRDDSSYPLLCSLEHLDEQGNLRRKADIFTKRTIRAYREYQKAETANEALLISLTEKAKVDLPYMRELLGEKKSLDDIKRELEGVIFKEPLLSTHEREVWQTADEYLSGDVRKKLKVAQFFAEGDASYIVNVEALKKVQPVDLSAAEIDVRLGTTWIPAEVVQEFVYELLNTPAYIQKDIRVLYLEHTAEWQITHKSFDRGNVQANTTYGTERANAYRIIEDSLNLRDTRIYDYEIDSEGRKHPVLNKDETVIAQGKQAMIKQAFRDWIWQDQERRTKLVDQYNNLYNSVRPREYDGSHLNFPGMNSEIQLRQHQKNAVARILYGGNALLAHVVGAGKTFTMVAAAQESKRLGLSNKSLFIVPNHLVEQWASEYLQLYPTANILVTRKKDFEKQNRKKFCSRIATGDYDAIIMGHTQFEKIPMSKEYQEAFIEKQINDILVGIAILKEREGERFQIKALERSKKSLEKKLNSLLDDSKKDDVITFEALGVDKIFVDEAHYYKNLAAYSKMRNVAGISQTEAQKSSDLFMKCRYLDEQTGGKGIVFATGTPISNSMVELYTMQRYLQYSALESHGIAHFDCWASTFGETVTAIELAPEGNSYRTKTRFAKFFNLPELMNLFREVADIQTADMLNLPVPKANYETITVEPSEIQKKLVTELSMRAEDVREKRVSPEKDNMLRITNDGRKLALDQRIIDPMLPEAESGKVAVCAEQIYRIWQESKAARLTQLVFCDLSTPNARKENNMEPFSNVYESLKEKLLLRGVPEQEIAFIHDADTEVRKKELFAKVRTGQVRILLGSTQKMGAGTNVQDKLIALHDLDCPWRPSDLEQRSGRIIRQGNQNEEVYVYRYVTKDTFDAYLYQTVENKQRFISQIMTEKSPVRSAEDIDEAALSYAEIKMLATGNPLIKEKMDLDIEVSRLKLLKSSHLNQKYRLEDQLVKYYPIKLKSIENHIFRLERDCQTLKEHPQGEFKIVIHDQTFTNRNDAGTFLLASCQLNSVLEEKILGNYRGFAIIAQANTGTGRHEINLKGETSHFIEMSSDPVGMIMRIENKVERIPIELQNEKQALDELRRQIQNAEAQVQVPFVHEEILREKMKRLDELDAILNNSDESIVLEDNISTESSSRKPKELER